MFCTGCWETFSYWFWIVPFLFMLLVCVFIAIMIRRAGTGRSPSGTSAEWMPFGCWRPGRGPMGRRWFETPRLILDRRYALGEITEDDYEQMKRAIE